MRAAYKSHPGKKRKNNEDSIYVDMERGIFLIADGMGGHQAGEVASNLAVNEGHDYLKNRLGQAETEKEIFKLLVESLMKANNIVREKAKHHLNLMGMGTTLIQVIVKHHTAYICHVGDSRAYLLRDRLRQITSDHTVGDYLVQHDIMPREKVPPQKWHTLTQAVGVSESPVPDLQSLEVKKGNYLLLCTDGLTDMLSDDEIERTIQNVDDIEKAVSQLIKVANRKGGKDNISVVLIAF